MPTYAFKCERCDQQLEIFLTIGQYLRDRPVYVCCSQPMERCLQVAPGKLYSADYEGLRASDGTDISTRTKHRQYMRDKGLTTIDDFKDTWQRDAKERAERLEGKDPSRRADIIEALHKLEH
jgi:hypothetical protein